MDFISLIIFNKNQNNTNPIKMFREKKNSIINIYYNILTAKFTLIFKK